MEDYKDWSLGEKVMLWFGGITLFLLIVLALGRMLFFNFIENYELAYKFDKNLGTIEVLKNKDGSLQKGYIYSYPFVVSVHSIDLRPVQVCITGDMSTNGRVLNCKLVEFNPDGLDTFIEWHGRDNYSNTSLESILKIYAYDGSDGKKYPFLTILKELKTDDDKVVNDTIK